MPQSIRISTLALVCIGAFSFSCGGNDDDTDNGAAGNDTTAGMQGDAGTSSGGTSNTGGMGNDGGTATGGNGTSASGGMGDAGSADAGSADGGDPSAGTGAGGAPAGSRRGACGLRGEFTATDDSFEGFEEYFVVSEEDLGEGILDEYICTVRFDVKRVGEAPEGCEYEGLECVWTHLVEFSNPQVMDEEGVCASSELGLDADAIAAIDGLQVAYGYVPKATTHGSGLLEFDESSDSWTLKSWTSRWEDSDTGEFTFDRVDSNNCAY